MIQLKKNGVAWEITPEFAPLLDEALASEGQPVKVTPTKLVTVHQLRDRTYYVKRYRNTGALFRSLKYFCKPSEARNEWQIAQQYTALGIPLVRHLALGERWGAFGLYESILVTEGFDGVPLSRGAPHQRADVQIALGKLLRVMHDGGALQPDLQHNILVHAEPLELRRIDVDRGEIKPSLTAEERLDNLAFLNIFVPLGDAFFAAYGADGEFARRVRARSPVLLRPLAAKRSRRCLETNLRFESHRMGGLRWWVRREFLYDKLQRLLEDPDAALASCARLFKSGPHRQSTVGAFDGFVLKRFNQKNRWNYLKDLFRTSRAYRAYQKAYHLELLGIPTPRPIAAAERRSLRVLRRSYLVTEEIRGATDLRTATKLDIDVASKTGQLIGQIHSNGFSHSDLKETNIIWDDEGKVYILDLDALDYVKQVSPERAAEDLQRLARGAQQSKLVTDAHRQAFLKGYCEARGLKEPPRC